jgi:thioredoxin-related protein
MNKLTEKIELTANILIIVVAFLLGAVLVQKYLLATPVPAQASARVQPTIGSKVNLPDINWADQPKTLILVLNKGCRFCNESAPFYKRIIENTQNKNVKLVAVFSGSIEENQAHLNELGLTRLEVKSSPLNNIQVSGTPTLLLTNDKGEITDFWIGKLTPDKEAEVLNKLNS